MPTLPTSADRAAEFQRLVVDQAIHIRAMSYGDPSTEHKETVDRRAARLVDLAELLGQDNPGAYVNERIAGWLKMNPLPLMTSRLHRYIEDHTDVPVEETVGAQVYVQIGDAGRGYGYRVMVDNVRSDGRGLFINIPESVAEHFRQQGRRTLQRELAGLLAVESRM